MTTNDIVPAIFGLAGTVIGALTSYVATRQISTIKRREETTAVTSALVTEVSVILFLMEKRGYLHAIEEILAALRANKLQSTTLEIRFPDNIFPVYRSNVNQIGIVPAPVRDDIVRFYQLLESAIADVRPGGHIATNQCGEGPFSQLHDIVSEAMSVGQRITTVCPKRPCNEPGLTTKK